MKHLHRLLIFCICTIILTTHAFSGDFGEQIIHQSRYYGVGVQDNGSHWSVEVLLDQKGGQIAYPSLECTGSWTLLKRHEQRVIYRENITEGLTNCLQIGTVILTPLSQDRLLYTWMEYPFQIIAHAVLIPVETPRISYTDLLNLTQNEQISAPD